LAEQGERLAVPGDGARVQDLEPLQDRRERQRLGDQQPLPGVKAALAGDALQPRAVAGEDRGAVTRAGDPEAALAGLDLEDDLATGAAFVGEQLRPLPPLQLAAGLGQREIESAPGGPGLATGQEGSSGERTGTPSCSTQAWARKSGRVRAPITSRAGIPRRASSRRVTSERRRQRVSPGRNRIVSTTARPTRRASSCSVAAAAASRSPPSPARSRATACSIGTRRSSRRARA
jgi:hypothetical protein